MALRATRTLPVLLIGLLIWAFASALPAGGHHTGVPCGAASGQPDGRAVCLPLMNHSVAASTLRSTGELTYCLNSRAAAYPNFREQVRRTVAQHEAALGIRWTEIAGTYENTAAVSAAGCQVWHAMPATHGCGWCGATVLYLNWPVVIEYRWQAGYMNWETTISHELGHVYGLHEHYDDRNPARSHHQTHGFWAHGLTQSPGTTVDAPTVMDIGTGVWQLTPYDVARVCESIDRRAERFVACGFEEPAPQPEPDPCLGPPTETGVRWDNCLGIWRGLNGNFSYLNERQARWMWEWGDCNRDNLRWNTYFEAWTHGGTALFSPLRGFWSVAPPC